MDGENNGKPNPMNKWDDLGVFSPLFLEETPIDLGESGAWFTSSQIGSSLSFLGVF